MYTINRLNRPVLITPDEVLFHAATDHSVDARQILQNIIIAEERIIVQAISSAFYEELIRLKNKTVTALNQTTILNEVNNYLAAVGKKTVAVTELPVGTIVNAIEWITNTDYLALWNRFLWKLTAEAVDMITTVPSWLRHTAQGQQKNNPEVIGGNGQNSVTGDRRDIQFKIDIQMQERIDPLIGRVQGWICERKDRFPAYAYPCSNDNKDGVSVLRKTDWVFNAYENPTKNSDCTMNKIVW